MIKVGIVGGGAAGLFAGCFLKKSGASFTILEKGNACGRKLLLTGHGRCNITNRKNVTELMKGYHEASNFMKAALSSFTPDNAIDFITDELQVPLKEEEDNRMFPVSDKASDIRDALVCYAGRENIITEFEVTDISTDEEGAFVVKSADGRSLKFYYLIMATGGRSYPKTGSDGRSYELLRNAGHKVTPLNPGLTGITMVRKDREFTQSVSGVSVHAGAGLYLQNRKTNKTEGDVLFTHKGLSGPAITELARYIPEDVTDRDGWIELDFTPGRDETTIDKEILIKMGAHPDKSLVSIGADYVPSSVSEAIGKRAGVRRIRSADITKSERAEYIRNLKHLHMTIESRPDINTAYVTRGGVELSELKRKTFESKIVPGLYIIGEAVDADGISGGYNLQAAMSEAYVAVRSLMC